MSQVVSAQKIPAILPVALTGYGSLNHKRIKILFFSLQKCQAQNWLDRIYIITPSHQKQIIAAACEDIDFLNIDILDEDRLFPEFKEYDNEGYKKQMLIKIGSHRLFESEFFLTLDSDIICLQKVNIERLIVGGKALLHYEDKNVHSDWWEASADILSVPLDYSSLGMSVTPAILSRTICKYSIEEIEQKSQQSWISVLMEVKGLFWTEYSLYFLCAQKRNCLKQYHLDSSDPRNIPLIDPNYTVWFAGDIEQLGKYQRSLPSGLFAVLQSNTDIPLETILNCLPVMLKLAPDDAGLVKLRQDILDESENL